MASAHDIAYPLATALLGRDDVSGVLRSAYRSRGGNWIREECITVCVKTKKRPEDLEPGQVIPHTIGGMGTDVIEVKPKLSLYSPKYSPLCGGISISGEGNESDGTMGAVFHDTVNDVFCGITNFHVASDESNPSHPVTHIIHPGASDDGIVVTDRIGKISRWEINEWGDAAIFTLSRDFALSQLSTHQVISSIREPDLGDQVAKVGRTTGVTYGEISGIGVVETDYSDYGYGTILVAAFSFIPIGDDPDEELGAGGDSGALVYCTTDDAGVGLFFAHAEQTPFLGLACILSYIAEDLEFEIIPPNDYGTTQAGGLSLGVPVESPATGSFSLVEGEGTVAVKLFSIDDWEKTYTSANFEEWVQDLGYADEEAFLTAWDCDTVEDWFALFGDLYETLDDFLATQTLKSVKDILADNGVSI